MNPAFQWRRWGPALRVRPCLIAVLVVATALRVAATVAYRPALEFNGDSYGYLHVADHLQVPTWHPVGYSLLLRVLSWTGSLAVVPVVQHLMGLATGLVVYRFCRQRGAGDAWAALAAAPVLLDAWSVSVEQGIVTEATFSLLVAVGLLLTLQRSAGVRQLAVGGGLLAAASIVRTTGLFVGLAVVAYLIVSRRGWRALAATGLAFAVPTLGYGIAFWAANHTLGPDSYGGRYLYGETAMVAQCNRLPPADQNICPSGPTANRAGPTSYVWGTDSPLLRVHDHSERSLNDVGGRFATAVIERQPVAFAAYVLRVTAHYFRVGRPSRPTDYTAQTWQFPASIHPPPVWSITVATEGFGHTDVHPRIDLPLTRVLRSYQQIGFTPGPALALAFVVALGAAATRRTPGSGDLAFLALLAMALLLVSSAASGAPFDYRYLLITLVMLPPAGVLGARELWRRFAPARPAQLTTAMAAGAVGVALVATNGLVTNVTPASAQQARTVHPIGTTVTLQRGMQMTLSSPVFWRSRCARVSSTSGPVWQWDVYVRLTARVHGSARLVQPGNVYTAERFSAVARSTARGGSWLSDVVLRAHEHRRSGRIVLGVTSPSVTASYTDPTGGGTSSWRFLVTPPSPQPTPGTPCVPPPPGR